MLPVSPIASPTGPTEVASNTGVTLQSPTTSEGSKMRFEQLLWAELLTHTGLEKALTMGGGEGASMFSRYFVEAIAADIAKAHPLGLLDSDIPTAPEAEPQKGETRRG